MLLQNIFRPVLSALLIGFNPVAVSFAAEQPSSSTAQSIQPDTFKKITAVHKTKSEIAGEISEDVALDSTPLAVAPETATDADQGSPGPASESAVPTKAVTTEPAPGLGKTTTAVKAIPHATKQEHTAKEAGGVDAETSLRWLTNGNTRYIKRQFRADGRDPKDRQRLLGGQKPHAIVLSCADSRVPPEIVFDQELGEIFVIRVAGEALDSSVIASIEYAVEHLDPHLLVVMGHTQCGAIEATLKTKEGSSAGSEALDKLLADIRPRLKSIPEGKGSANLEIESTVNADGVARDLLKRSEIIKKRVDSGDLVIKPALYRMDSGKVSFY